MRCWGNNDVGQSSPTVGLGSVAQVGVGTNFSCALTVSGELHCWGDDSVGQSSPPGNLGPVAELAVGQEHSCALTVSGQVHCWGNNSDGRSTPPADLGPVAELSVGRDHSCALTVSGRLRCWGTVVDISSLPAGMVTAVEYYGRCALLAEGSVYCPDSPELVPPGLGVSDVVMSVWPRQLGPGQRAAIRFTDLRDTAKAFTARIEVFGEGEADVSSYYRLLGSNGLPLVAEEDGSYLLEGGSPILGGDPNSPNSPQLAGNSLAGNSLEALYGLPLDRYGRSLAPCMSGRSSCCRALARPHPYAWSHSRWNCLWNGVPDRFSPPLSIPWLKGLRRRT